MHEQGIAHRDLKPQNCLLDQNFTIKIADFGFSCPLSGTTQEGFSTTRLGTPQYMAPEIWNDPQYQAFSADLFALGCILFVMRAKNIPFFEAKPTDPCYGCFFQDAAGSKFWEQHEANYEEGHFSPEFKDLVTRMLQVNPADRLSY